VCKRNTVENRRDTAIVRLLIDIGMRLSGLTGLGVDQGLDEVDLAVI
jgi:site-specific recombinase XerC